MSRSAVSLLLLALACAAHAAPEAATAPQDAAGSSSSSSSSDPLSAGQVSLDRTNLDAVAAAFARLLSAPYDLSEAMLPNAFSLKRAGLSGDMMAAVEDLRASLRQGLGEVVAAAANRSAEWVAAASAELQRHAAASGGEGGAASSQLLQRLSSIPIKFDAQGNTLLSSPLAAMGGFLVNGLQARLATLRRQRGAELNQQLAASAAGRRLLQEMDAFQLEGANKEGADEEDSASAAASAAAAAHGLFDGPPVDLAGRGAHSPLAIAARLERLGAFLSSLVDVADEVAELQVPADDANEGQEQEEGTAGASAGRSLQQAPELLADPNTGYAKAVNLIFSNVFDFFRGDGLYGLTPLLADLRAILTRYNWISDVLNILDAPLENFVNANYVPLPQSDDDFVKLIQKFAGDFCKLEKAASSETVLGEFEGATLSFEVAPVSCPIYTDPDTGRSFVSFGDCEPAVLKIKTTPLTITEAYFSAAEYASTECKYSEPYGLDLSVSVGRGDQSFTFTRSAKGIDILPTVIQTNGRGRFANFAGPDATPDSNLPGADPAVGNGFFANNFGWSFAG